MWSLSSSGGGGGVVTGSLKMIFFAASLKKLFNRIIDSQIKTVNRIDLMLFAL